MKITMSESTYYVIFTPHSGTQPLCFWGDSPYDDGKLYTHSYLSSAWRFNTREEAQAEIRKHPQGGEAKAVRVTFTSTATIYTRNS